MTVLPEEFSRYTRQLMGDGRYERFVSALEQPSVVSIRTNSLKFPHPQPQLKCVPWCHDAYYLQERPNFTFDPLLHAGYYYVQEASSMFIDQVLRQYVHHPAVMLDMCAAPGGKSTAAISALPEGSMLVSNEPIRTRSQILAENIQKWGYADCMVTNCYPKDYHKSGAMFDVILCDVPCSGEGMFRKDEGAIQEWSAQHVAQCTQLQREIVTEAWHCLRDGGLMIYSTCTFNAHEDEENVAWLMEQTGAEILTVNTEEDWHITGSLLPQFQHPVYRFIPGYTQGEGLFMAVLRKPGKDTDNGTPADTKRTRELINKKLRPIYNGIPAPTQKGKDLIPAQAAALSPSFLTAMRQQHREYPMAEVNYQQAMQYLRHEAITLPADTPRGIVLICFQYAPLGFAKNIGNRANNLYPQEWKIKSSHVPTEYEPIIRP
jgi:16S rRNA C967 or C1407 C5-methylase (RsmB/RsmF family)